MASAAREDLGDFEDLFEPLEEPRPMTRGDEVAGVGGTELGNVTGGMWSRGDLAGFGGKRKGSGLLLEGGARERKGSVHEPTSKLS